MSAAALALALAILLPGRSGAARVRDSSRPRTAARGGRNRTGGSSTSDPFAAASALDIFATCLSAGMAAVSAARITARSAPTELAALLRRSADLLALGAEPAVAWAEPATVGDEQSGVAALALFRLARRSAASGTTLADGVTELAIEMRQRTAHDAAAAGERAGVLIAGPLGLCFLPAFICVGVVPVVAGLARDVFASGLL